MNSTKDKVYTTAAVKPLKFSPSVFINIISAQREIYLDKRDYYAESHDDINMRYYEHKADACRELLRIITENF